MYLDSENWLKASIEYENDRIQRLGSVVTNHGYSDWASVDVDASIKSMWFRFSRREDDFCVENSLDGQNFKQMRICHIFEAKDTIRFGIMPAVRKIPHSVPFLQIWSSWNANGFLTTDRLRMKMRAVRPDGKTGIREAFLLLPGKSGMCPNQEPALRSDPFSLRTVSPSIFSTFRS